MDSQPSQSSGRFSLDQINNKNSSRSSNSQKINSSSSSLSKSISDASSLSAILNNPQLDATWTSWWSPSTVVSPAEFASINIAIAKTGSEINKSQFQAYLLSIFEQFSRFNDIQSHRIRESGVEFDQTGGGGVGQGEALVACLRQVPALYFKEDFQLEDGGTFRAACPFSTPNDNLVLQEKLSQYLDVVELHLVKEISLRSNSFFEAQEHLEGLNVRIVQGCSRIRELKETIRILDSDLVHSARQIQELNSTRGNLLALQQKLRLILNVNQALSALKLVSSIFFFFRLDN